MNGFDRLAERGRNWFEKNYPETAKDSSHHSELRHYGVKGMKWGVRRTPEQLGHKRVAKNHEKNTIIDEAVRSGKVSLKINREKQMKHTKSHHIPGRSYLDGDLDFAQELVDRLSGTGEAKLDSNGNWNNKEMVINSEILGTHVNPITGIETRTNKAVIVYSKTGTHIYPR